MIRRMVPEFILRKDRAGDYAGKFKAWVMHVDLRDFSLLSSSLMKEGSRKVEQLSDIINSVFSPALETILKHGGFVSRFAGDAFIAIFPISDDDTALNCISAAGRIRDLLKFGPLAILSSRIGISRGNVSWQILPNPHRHLYWFSGAAIHNAIVLQESAESNQILVATRNLTKSERERLVLSEQAPGVSNIREILEPVPPGRLPKCRLSQKEFVAQELIHGVEGEFREVVSVFINLKKQNAEELSGLIGLTRKYGAYLNKVFNSSHGLMVLVLFGAPKGYEDIVQRSFRFVNEIKTRYGKQIRIGMSMGLTYAGFVGSPLGCEYTAMGLSVNLAARLVMLGDWGEVCFEESLISVQSVNLVYSEKGLQTIKGFAKPVPCFKFECIREDIASQYLSPFMGREREIKSLLRSKPGIRKNTGLTLNYVYGDPGTGKSRLLYEYGNLFAKGCQRFTLQCDGILKSSLHPFVFFIKKQFNGLKSGSVEQRRQNFRRKYQAMVQKISGHLDEGQIQELNRMESVLAGLISLDWEGSLFRELGPAQKSSAISDAIINLFGFYALYQPTILLIEDIQWLDHDSRLILQRMLVVLRTYNIQIICSARYNDDGSLHTLDGTESAKSIRLGQWDVAQIKDFASRLLKCRVSESLAMSLQERTLGNLLHVEQICEYLVVNDMLEPIDGLMYIKDTGIKLSSGINAMLTARIDRLDKSMKEAVQAASVLGNEFTAEVLQELLQRSQAFSGELANPCEILENGCKIRLWNMLNEVSYSFSHGLLRDTVYGMQLRKHLQKLHGIAAEIMVDYWKDDCSKYAEIARQFEQAGKLKESAHFYALAGTWARELFQETESLNYLNKAVEILKQIGGEEKKVADHLMEIALLFHGFGKYDLAMGYLRQAEKIYISAEGEESLAQSSCLGNIASVKKGIGDYDGALEDLQRALNIMQNNKDAKVYFIATCYCNMGECYQAKADFEKALEVYHKALKLREDHFGDSHEVVANTLINLASLNSDINKHEQAKVYIDRAMQIYETMQEANYLARSIMYANAARTYMELGFTEEGMEYNYKSLRLGKEGLGPKHPDTMLTQFNIAQVCIDNEDYEKAMELMLEVREAWQESLGEKHPWMALCLSSIGKLKTIAGDPHSGLEICCNALNILHEIHGKDHPWCSHLEENIGLAKKELGMSDERGEQKAE